MVWIFLMLVCGMFLSAFFSGSETGFYRVTRVRLVIKALRGDRVSRGLLWLTNNPALFVATTLIGNNVANYITSLAIVMGAHVVIPGSSAAEIVAPLLLAPLLFIFGELLPKKLYYQAPNRLLRAGGPLLLTCAVLLAPLSLFIWALNRVLQSIMGASPQRIRLTLARKELHQVLQEGHEAGVLRPSQRALAQGLLAMANEKVAEFAIPPGRMAKAKRGMSKAEVLRLAGRHRLPALPVEEAGGTRRLIGYVRVVDLHLEDSPRIDRVRPLLEIPESESHLSALMRLQVAEESMGRVVGAAGETVGIVTVKGLSEPLFRGR